MLDAAGQPIGWFRKDFGKSILRSSWHMGFANSPVELFGTERNKNVAIARRLWEFVPYLNDLPPRSCSTSTSPTRTARSC